MKTKRLDQETEERYKNLPIQNFPFEFKTETNDNRKIYALSVMKNGQGGFGIAYKGRYLTRKGNKRPWEEMDVVIKEFFIKGLSERSLNGVNVFIDEHLKDNKKEQIQGYLERFKNESEILANITDDNIVDVIHSFSSNGTSYYVMDYINGKELYEYIKNQGHFVSFEKAWSYYRPICVALSNLHRNNNIAHRDIQPRNILVKMDSETNDIDKFVLIDFGNCKYHNEDKCLTFKAPAGHTLFSPPELLVKKDLSIEDYKKSDIYSLGAVLYYILTGNLPPEDKENEELEIPDYMSWQVVEIIKKAMMPNIKDRYESILAFIEACDRAIKTSFDANAKLNISPQITLDELNKLGAIDISIPSDNKTMNSKAILNKSWNELIGDAPVCEYKVGELRFKRITIISDAASDNKYELKCK